MVPGRFALLGALVTLACRERDAAGPAGAPDPTPAPADAIADDRRCGEAGREPTALPPVVAAGFVEVGHATLAAGDARNIGTVAVEYKRDAWIGTMRAGRREPALVALIDRAEAGDGPWGEQQPLHADQSLRLHVGPYRIDARTSDGTPPREVAVEVARAVCPASAVIDPGTLPASLWLSTEAIRQHTFDVQGVLLQVALDARGAAPRLDVSTLGYRAWFEPRPGEPRTLRVADHVVTIEEVVPGPRTRFAGAWQADGDARVHARLRIERAAQAPPDAPAPADDPCGGPSPRRTDLPQHLAGPLAAADEVTLATGEARELGPLALELVAWPPGPDGAAPLRQLRLRGGVAVPGAVFLPEHVAEPRLARAPGDLLHITTAAAPGSVRVQRLPLRCPASVALPTVAAPTYVWLSTLGHTGVVVGDPTTTARLDVQLHLDIAQPTLAVTTEQAHVTRPLAHARAGEAYTIAGHLVELVDVRADASTRLADGRWTSTGPAPQLHVQVKLSPLWRHAK